jgi:hypothetical protein
MNMCTYIMNTTTEVNGNPDGLEVDAGVCTLMLGKYAM